MSITLCPRNEESSDSGFDQPYMGVPYVNAVHGAAVRTTSPAAPSVPTMCANERAGRSVSRSTSRSRYSDARSVNTYDDLQIRRDASIIVDDVLRAPVVRENDPETRSRARSVLPPNVRLPKVSVTRAGKKYHAKHCPAMNEEDTGVKARELSPCKVCTYRMYDELSVLRRA